MSITGTAKSSDQNNGKERSLNNDVRSSNGRGTETPPNLHRRPGASTLLNASPILSPANGPQMTPSLKAVAYNDRKIPLAAEVKAQLEAWHQKYGDKPPPVASQSYANETRMYKAFGSHGEKFSLAPYEVQKAGRTYGIWVLRRPGHPDVAVKYLSGGPGKVYYSIWLGDEQVAKVAAVVKIFRNEKTGEYPFVFEQHVSAFNVTGKDEGRRSSHARDSMAGTLKRKRGGKSSEEESGTSEEESSSSEDEPSDILPSGVHSRHGGHKSRMARKQTSKSPLRTSETRPGSARTEQRHLTIDAQPIRPNIPESLCFYFLSSKADEVIRIRRIRDCTSAEKLFESAREAYGFFDKITELRCVSCNIKNCNSPPLYVLNANELDFEMVFNEIEKLQKSETPPVTWSVEVRPVII